MYPLISSLLGYWKALLWSSTVLFAICLTNYLVVLPISGLYLVAYLTMTGVLTTWLSFVGVQNFLQRNKPVEYLIEFKTYQPSDELDHVHHLCLDIDQYFINKWFIYISKDRTFNEESYNILKDVIDKILKVQCSLDNQVIVHTSLNLYLKHLKEYKRSLKRQEKYNGRLTDLYRYSHTCSSSRRAKEYFIHRLTLNLLNNFINWELSNSLPYQILASIISKKFTTYLLNITSNPQFLNYVILNAFASPQMKTELGLDQYNRIKIINFTESGTSTPSESLEAKLEGNVMKPNPVTTMYDDITDDVKIYEAKSCKTWYNSLDLDTVTLGQDILDIIGDSDKESDYKEEITPPMSSAKHLMDEMKQITSLEGFKTSVSEATATTLHNMKELESTMSSVVKPVSQVTTTAFHKIGGLHLQDEAAGVVEGLLDFGRSKFREGLRLTGLQESPTEGIVKPVKSTKSEDQVDTRITKIPSILTEDNTSPELEYEETADLATSIAKLRSLLEQKSSESNMSTPALSPMPSEEVASKIMMELDETDGVMPSFYKFCAKTATGVFNNTLNTIKTALPGNISEYDQFLGSEGWLFVEAQSDESDLAEKMDKLLNERKAFCTVDTAYEAIDSLAPIETHRTRTNDFQFEDELDDFSIKFPNAKTLVDIVCELLSDSKTCLIQEPVIKTIMLVCGHALEEYIKASTKNLTQKWCSNLRIPSESRIDVKTMEMQEFIEAILSGIPDAVGFLIKKEVLSEAIKLGVSSLQVQKINQDVVMQIFEIISLKLAEGSKQLNQLSA